MELVYTLIVKNRLSLALFSFLLCGLVFAKPGALDASFEKDVRALMKQDHYAGMAIVVLRDGKEIYAKGFGFRDLARKKPMTPDTLVNFASITKSFSSAAIAKLVDMGKVRWDTPLKKYLPNFQLADAKSTEAVTIRDVLSHRTGIPRNNFLWEVTGSEEDHLFQSLSLLPANAPLRSKWQYSNLLYILVPTRLIRAVSGSDYNTFITSRFLEPLKMQRSSLFDRQRKSDSDSATPYRWNGKQFEEVLGGAYDQYAGAGALNSSAREMARWAALQLSNGTVGGTAILSATSLREMQKPQIEKNCGLKLGLETKCAYGMGWNLYDFPSHARRWYFHTGGSAGFSTHMDFVPATKTAVLIATNHDVEGPSEETLLAVEIHRDFPDSR